LRQLPKEATIKKQHMADIIQSTTQQFLDIYDITNNFVVMKDGTVSTILTVDAMNFGLLAEEEQDAIMYAYAGLLNSLNYSVQIIINSRTKDVTSYLKVLQEQETTAETETLRRRIRMYREFVGNLIHERNVLDKKFYVVIPAAAVEMGFLAPASVLPGKTNAFDISSIERSVIIEKARNLLDPKRDHLIAQFARIGLFSRQLSTQEIIQLFYVRYNPEAVEGQQIGESSSYTTPLVKASIQGNFMNTPTQTVPQPQAIPEVQASLDPVVTQSMPEMSMQPAHLEPVPEIHIAAVAPETVAAPFTPTEPPAAPVMPPMATMPQMSQPPAIETPISPVVSQPPVVNTPPMQTIEIPAATPPVPENTLASTGSLPSEAEVQADLNTTLQSLGTTPDITSVPPTQPAADLPPLPEI
jgi:hypothetical protein